MRSSSPQAVRLRGLAAVALLSVLLLTAGSWLTSGAAAQKEGPQAQAIVRPADLGRAAARAPGPVAAAYRALAEPQDEVKLAGGEQLRVAPLPSRPAGSAAVALDVLGPGEPGERSVPAAEIASYTPYEDAALARAEALLADKDLPAAERTGAAENIVAVALRFHLGNRDRPAGPANAWAELEARLNDRLLEVRRQRLASLAAAVRQEEDWKRALALADRLEEVYPEDKALRGETADLWAGYASDRLKAGDFVTARAYLERLDRQFLSHPQARGLRESLEAQARVLVKEARSLKDKAALMKLEEALGVWPRLPGLRDELLKAEGAYPVLYVGVRGLPENLSPATAWTDPEKQAVELLFERLIHEEYEDEHGSHYRADLSERQADVIPDGRRFRLKPDARWSDGKQVTALDVRHTVHLLQAPDLPGRTPEWTDRAKLLEIESDLFRVEFRYLQGYLDPLAPLAFFVLPQTLEKADAPEFARAPVGSGPYRYAGRKQEAGRTCAVFVANPHYCRANHPDRPHIREVRFYVPTDPAGDFRDKNHPLHLLLDVPSGDVNRLHREGVRDVRTLENRRVYFLALNHRTPVLANEELRRALAYGIDRERILTDHFRGGNRVWRLLGVTGAAAAAAAPRGESHPEYHRPLNGPYPPRCWACDTPPRVPASLYDPERARFALRKAGLAKVLLTLKYPNDDPRVAQACQEIARQLAEVGKGAGCAVSVTPVGMPPREFRQALDRRDYELAYHHHDYTGESYWLWPLFDSRPGALAPGGSNYLGYQNDAKLESLFREAMSHRDFKSVQEVTHAIHGRLLDRMPLIPLWQLDTHLAVHPALAPAHLDPLRVFSRPAEWKLLQN